MDPIDVVIPAHAKDLSTLPFSIRGVLQHLEPIRRVYVVSQAPFEWPDPRVRWVTEPSGDSFPSLTSVRARLAARDAETPRATWIYQQLLKLGAPEYIDDLAARYLVVDADVIFLRKTSYETAAGIALFYSRTAEYQPSYQNAFEYLLGTPPRDGHSVIAHHMLYDCGLLSELKAEIAKHCGRLWHEAYLDATDPAETSAISEQDVYGWFVLDHHPERACERKFSWIDVPVVPRLVARRRFARDYDFAAAHAYLRKPRWRIGMDVLARQYRRVHPRAGVAESA